MNRVRHAPARDGRKATGIPIGSHHSHIFNFPTRETLYATRDSGFREISVFHNQTPVPTRVAELLRGYGTLMSRSALCFVTRLHMRDADDDLSRIPGCQQKNFSISNSQETSSAAVSAELLWIILR